MFYFIYFIHLFYSCDDRKNIEHKVSIDKTLVFFTSNRGYTKFWSNKDYRLWLFRCMQLYISDTKSFYIGNTDNRIK